MLDHPDKTTKLLAALKAAVPFEVELTEWLVKQLRAAPERWSLEEGRASACLAYCRRLAHDGEAQARRRVGWGG
jgi:hypothetical protein